MRAESEREMKRESEYERRMQGGRGWAHECVRRGRDLLGRLGIKGELGKNGKRRCTIGGGGASAPTARDANH